MDREMININANLVKEAEFSEFEKDGESVQVANFALVKKYGNGKEYTNCSVYGENREGKTTAIRMITSLIRVNFGEILINYKPVIKNRDQAIKNIGIMVESLKLMAKLIDGTSDEDIYKLLELVGLKDIGKDKFAS